jgi:diguanylate cyclase (GGDEF)-like protein
MTAKPSSPRAPTPDLDRQNAVLTEQFERRGAALRELVELGELAAQTRDLDEFLVAVAERLLRVTGAADCDIFTVSPGGELRCLVSVDRQGRDHSVTGDLLELDDFGPNGPAVRSGELVVVADRSDPALTEYDHAAYEAFGFESEVCVPLVSDGTTIALAEIYDTQPRDYAECLDFLRHVSQIVGGAYERAAALDRQAQQSARLASLLESSRAVAAAGHLDTALQVVARVTAETLDVPECIVYELDTAAEAIVPRAIYQRRPSGWDKLGVPFALADHPVERSLLRSGVPREEHLSDPGLDRASRDAMSAWGDKTCLSVPLILGDELTGLMALYEHERERHFTDEEVSLVRGLGEQAAAAIHHHQLLRRLEERNTVLNALLDTGRATTSTLQLGEVLSILVREAAAALASPFCLIWEYDAERDAIAERECWDISGRYVVRGDEVEQLAERPEQAVVLFADGPVVETVSDPHLDAASRESMERCGEKTCLSVPVVFGEERLGILVFCETEAERRFSAAELELAAGLADRAAVAIHNARLYEAVERRNRELAARVRRERFINESSADLSSSLDLEVALASAARRFATHFAVTACDVHRLDEHGGLRCVASVAHGEACPERVGRRPAAGECASDRLAVEGARPVLIGSLRDARLDPAERRAMAERSLSSGLVVPIVAREQVLGTIDLLDARERDFTDEDIATAEAVCGMVGLAVQNADLFAAQGEHARRLAKLVDAGHSIASPVVAQDVVATIAQKAAEALGSPECIIYEFDAEADTLTARAIFQETPAVYHDLGKPFALDHWPLDRAILEGREVLVETLSDPAIDAMSRASMEECGEKTCLNAPLYFGDEPLGILVLIETARERTFSDDDLAVLAGLSTQAAIALHHARLFERLQLRTFETEVLNEIARGAASSLNLADIAEATVTHLRSLVAFGGSCLVQLPPGGSMSVAYAEAGRALHDQRLEDIDAGFLERLRSERVVVAELGDQECLPAAQTMVGELRPAAVVGLFDDGRLSGALTLTGRSGDFLSRSDRRVLEGVGAHLSLAIKNVRLYDTAKHLHLGNLKALSSALLAKDYYTIGHTARVATYAVLLAAELGWPRALVDEVEEIAYLHDIGKIAVSDQVLLKTGPLTDEEWALMRQHPVISAEIIEPLLDEALVAGVRHHHEHYDGSGYPDGLAGAEIPEIARLMAVVDAYDAMSSRRVYRTPLTYSECLEELRACRDRQFDPLMVDAFLRVLQGIEAKKRRAAAAAQQAAALIDPAGHALLRTPADMQRPEYGQLLEVLRGVRAAHPSVRHLSTMVLADDLRAMMVLDSDEDPQGQAAIGHLMFADDEQLHVLRGQATEANVVYVDGWGAWVGGLAPVRDAAGAVIAVVCADVNAADVPGLSLARSRVSETFSSIASCAAERLTRAEVDAMTDSLTGLYNHRHLQQRLEEELLAAAQKGGELSLLFCDVDDFKELNDRHGHGAGDEALKGMAQIVKRTVRRFDLAARYGGDEFAVVLPGVGASEAREIAERLRWNMQHASLRPVGGGMTLSIGIATAPADGQGKDELLRAADAAMYLAKHRGRNRCEHAAEDAAPAGEDAGAAPLSRSGTWCARPDR